MDMQNTRETEVSRQLYVLNDTASMLNKTAEELMQRLSSVLAPATEVDNENQLSTLVPITPLATKISEATNKLLNVEKKMRLIINSCEL